MRLRKLLLLAGVLDLFLLTGILGKVFAQENAVSSGTESQEESSAGTSGVREMQGQEIASDRQELKEQRQDIAENANAARQVEREAKDQIHQALQSGDYETAKNLRDQLKEIHQKNVEQMYSDIQELKESREGLRNDAQDARLERGLPAIGSEGGAAGFNSPGVGPNNPPGRDLPPGLRDKAEDRFDRREDALDRREDVRDRREDVWDAAHNPPPGTEAYRRDKLEDVRDHREDVRDRAEDVPDRREDVRDRRENFREGSQERQDHGLRDRGPGMGAGRGQGGEHRADVSVPGGNGPGYTGESEHRGGGQAHAGGGEHRGAGGPMHAGAGHTGGARH